MSSPTGRHVLVTATVIPQTDRVALVDPEVRLNQYLESLAFLSTQKDIDGVTIVENSGNDFSHAASKTLGGIPSRFLCYSDSRRNIPIAALEARMYFEFLRRWPGCDYREIIKLTGRYCIQNFSRVFSGQGNIAFSFRPTWGQSKARAVLTSAYRLEFMEFHNWSAFLEHKGESTQPLEMQFAEFMTSRKLHSIGKQYPEIRGYSGTFGTPYSASRKEKLRIALSRHLSFGFTWQTPLGQPHR